MNDDIKPNESKTRNADDTTLVRLRMTNDEAEKLRTLFDKGELTHLGILDLIIQSDVTEVDAGKKWSEGQKARPSSHNDRSKQ